MQQYAVAAFPVSRWGMLESTIVNPPSFSRPVELTTRVTFYLPSRRLTHHTIVKPVRQKHRWPPSPLDTRALARRARRVPDLDERFCRK